MKPVGDGAEPGHFSADGQLARWIALFPLARLGQIGGKEAVDLVRLQHSGDGLLSGFGVCLVDVNHASVVWVK